MAGARRPDVTAIPLGRPSPDASSNQPEQPSQRTRPRDTQTRRASLLFGFAPGGACRAADVAARAVRSYRTLSPLPNHRALRPKIRRFAFCGAFPGVAPAGRYPAPHPFGARTFLRVKRRPSGRLAKKGICVESGGGQAQSDAADGTRRGLGPRGTKGSARSLKLHSNYGSVAGEDTPPPRYDFCGNRGATKFLKPC
jgi:hypothetical protein